jgi:hypothetical protein
MPVFRKEAVRMNVQTIPATNCVRCQRAMKRKVNVFTDGCNKSECWKEDVLSKSDPYNPSAVKLLPM